MEREGCSEQALTVVFGPQPEGLCESPRAHCDQCRLRFFAEPPKPPHSFLALDGFGRSQQDRGGSSVNFTHDIDAGVDPVTAVGVEPPSGSEHGLVALGRAAVSVGGGIAAVSEIGFDLRDPNHESLSIFQAVSQATADQLSRDAATIAGIEALGKRFSEAHSGGRSVAHGREYRP